MRRVRTGSGPGEACTATLRRLELNAGDVRVPRVKLWETICMMDLFNKEGARDERGCGCWGRGGGACLTAGVHHHLYYHHELPRLQTSHSGDIVTFFLFFFLPLLESFISAASRPVISASVSTNLMLRQFTFTLSRLFIRIPLHRFTVYTRWTPAYFILKMLVTFLKK